MKLFVALAYDGEKFSKISYIHSDLDKLEKILIENTKNFISYSFYEIDFNPEQGLFIDKSDKLNCSSKFIKKLHIACRES